MENLTELLLNETFIVKNISAVPIPVSGNKTIPYYIRPHDRIDTFCDSKEIGTELKHFLICGFLQSIIHIVGIIGNFFTILVLRKPDSHAVVYVFLYGLVISDFFILIINGIFLILPQFLKYCKLLPWFYNIAAPILAKYIYPPINMGYTSATYFTALLILERYVVICRPFYQRRLCSLTRGYKISFGILIISILINIPRFFEFESIPIIEKTTNLTIAYDIIPTSIMTIRNYRKFYLFIVWFMTRFVIPVSTIVVCTSSLFIHILSSYIKRKILSTARRHETTLGKIAILISIIFLLCNVPTNYSRIHRGFRKYKPKHDILYTSNVLLAFNASIKWVVLSLYKTRFRTHYFQLFSLPCSCILEIWGWTVGKQRFSRKIRNSRIPLNNEVEEDNEEEAEAQI